MERYIYSGFFYNMANFTKFTQILSYIYVLQVQATLTNFALFTFIQPLKNCRNYTNLKSWDSQGSTMSTLIIEKFHGVISSIINLLFVKSVQFNDSFSGKYYETDPCTIFLISEHHEIIQEPISSSLPFPHTTFFPFPVTLKVLR